MEQMLGEDFHERDKKLVSKIAKEIQDLQVNNKYCPNLFLTSLSLIAAKYLSFSNTPQEAYEAFGANVASLLQYNLVKREQEIK
jgi:hypothetical protein